MEQDNIIRFNSEGEEVEFEVYDEVEYNNHKYLLVVEIDDGMNDESDDEEAEGIILKQIQEEDNDYIYELIQDEQEYLMVLELFRENSDDYDLDYIKED